MSQNGEKRIGLIAPQLMITHTSYYEAIITLFLEKNFLVHVFSDTWLAKELSPAYPKVEFVTKRQKESFFSFFHRIRKKAKQCDLVIIEQSYGITLSYIFGFSTLKVKKLYTVHNVNSWIAPKFSLKFKAFFTNLSHLYIIDKADGVIVVSSNVKEFITSLNLIGAKPVFYLPFSLPATEVDESNGSQNDISTTISLVVPGTINPVRRDYITLLNAYEKVLEAGKRNIELVLLGRPDYDIEDVHLVTGKIKMINNKFEDSIRFWNDFIPPAEYRRYLRNADFLIMNLNISYPYSENYEIYGITKETGIPTLMLEYRKPCILIGGYIVQSELKKQIISVTTEDEIAELLQRISEGEIKSKTFTANYEPIVYEVRRKINKELDLIQAFVE